MKTRNTRLKQSLLAAAGVCIAVSAGSAQAQTDNQTDKETGSPVSIAAEQNPYDMKDDSWVSIYGTVTNASDDGFDLNMGERVIRVEMDDYDDWPEARVISEGMDVAVVGRIDDDLFEQTSIEASTVYIDGLNTVFWANSADEEQLGDVAFFKLPDLSNVVLEGRIQDINVRKGTFSLATGTASYNISVEELGYNPLDEIGYQKLSENDRVRITSQLDNDAIRTGQLEATSLISLWPG